MPEDKQKNIVAALLAVHSGIVTPDQAVKLVNDPDVASTIADFDGKPPVFKLPVSDDEFEELPFIDVLEDPAKQRRALDSMGISETVQQTLFSFGGNGDTNALADTFREVARSGRKLSSTDIRPAVVGAADSEAPTQRPEEKTGVLRLSTAKFLPNFGFTSERYEIRREHARGGMGRIMLARDKAIGRDIALKELLPGLGGSNTIAGSVPQQYTNESGGIVERFLREAKITGQLEHPNIVPVYEIGKHDDGSIYYTMRFVRGKTLADRLREIRKDETLNKQEKLAARIKLLDSFIDVCQAIAYAHSKGVIHRDLKPENIMLGDFGETQVLDWGLARVSGQEDKALRDLQKGSLALSKSLIESDSQALTLDGSIVGTPAYMPPEQARGELENVDEQSDVYSLGAVLYQILTGYPPYEGPMAALIVQQVLSGPPARVTAREKDVPPELEALVEKAMARDKRERIRSALELASEVKAFRDGRTLGSYSYSMGEMIRRYFKQNRTSVSIGVLGFLLLVAGTIFFVQRLQEQRDAAMNAQAQAESKGREAADSLAMALSERAERQRVEEQARERAQAELDSRVGEARRLIETIDGMRIGPAVEDMHSRLSEYESRMAGPPSRTFIELAPAEQTSNAVLLSTLLGYISSKQNLIDLLTGPAGTQLPGEVAQFDLEAARTELTEIRFSTSKLAGINGDFQLAQLLLSSSTMPADRVTAAKAALAASRADVLRMQRRRISEALADVDAGLRREWRDPDAPTLEGYVSRLSSYRERQTVEMLAIELDRLLARDVESWTAMQFDLARVVCRVLGNINQPLEAVPVLSNLLERTERPELIMEAAHALCNTGSGEALAPLFKAKARFGIDFWQELQAGIARLPMPARLRQPQTVQDWIDRSAVMLARGDVQAAEAAALRATNLDERSADALLQRALVHRAMGQLPVADRDLTEALLRDATHFDVLLTRGRLRSETGGWDLITDDFDAAIAARPDSWRGWHARALLYASRFKLAEARHDFDKALELQPWRIETYLEYGSLLQSRADAQGAMAVFNRAVDRWPEDWRGWSARAFLRRERGMGGAYEDALQAVQLNPRDASSWDVLSQVHFAWSRFVDGIESATKAVEINPQQWLAWYYRGLHWHKWQEREDGQRRRAQTDSERSLPGANQGGGMEPMTEFLRARNERLTNAARDFGEALKIMPDDFRTSYLLAETLIQLERYDDALRVINDALAINPFCYMRWGGMVIPEMRHWQSALAYRHLANTEPANDRERIGKAMFNAMAASASVHMIHEERQLAQLAEAEALLREVASLHRQLAPGDFVLFCHAMDRTADALIAGGGREFYLNAQRLYDMRPSRFTDYGTDVRFARILVGLARAIRDGGLPAMDGDDPDFADYRDPMIRQQLEETNLRLAMGVMRGAVGNGLRWSDVEGLWNLYGFRMLEEIDGYPELREALDTPKPATTPGESLYGETLVLVDVTEGAPAWLAGLRRFDRLVSLNGRPIASAQEFMNTWGPITEGTAVKLQVERFVMRNNELVPVTDASGKPVLDDNGFVQWQVEKLEFTVTRGFLGVSVGMGMIPPRFAR